MKFVLECRCGSTDFKYIEQFTDRQANHSVFICNDCETITDVSEAGEWLIAEEDILWKDDEYVGDTDDY